MTKLNPDSQNLQLDNSLKQPIFQEKILSVSELAQIINLCLEQNLPSLSFEGEISQATLASSGHLYLRFKDSKSQVDAVMWAGVARTLSFRPEQGMKVICVGRPNFYFGSGKLQIVLSKMFPSGEGELQKKFLKLKAKLEDEGLFASQRKRPLPFLPKAIGVVTSATGAAIHDIMVKLKERMPSVPVYLVDVRVQGEGASAEISRGLDYLDSLGLVDVIIVGRGGGSLEDLWAFNEELVVRAIFRCKTPVVSAVGHEVDISLSDLVADVRAPTPTAAAEIVVPKRSDLIAVLDEYQRRMADLDRWFYPLQQPLDEAEQRLNRRMNQIVESSKLKLSRAASVLTNIEPRRQFEKLNLVISNSENKIRNLVTTLIRAENEKINYFNLRLQRAVNTNLEKRVKEVEARSNTLTALSPQRVLERGYAIVRTRNVNGETVRNGKQVVTGVEDLKKDQIVDIKLAQSGFLAKVEQVYGESN